ncbi:hypothetical protein ACOXVJ_13705, partial [Pseudomonas knackmussii]|uniref:hypothetical protein n=1 Tax=Pseudomonas knackmussii TaxID=65741 RepID=UPI003BD8F336
THSTAAFLTVKLFFENLFSTQPLALSSSSASRQREAHITALIFAVKHLGDLLSSSPPRRTRESGKRVACRTTTLSSDYL